jgi:tetratricopeptide (TPR) repeat protein
VEPEAVKVRAKKAGPKPRAPAKRRSAPKKPAYDEYDQLAKAAGDDAFVDGRPPVRDYEWYMRQGRAELAGGNYSRARAFFDSALEARPGSADAMDGLGHVSTRIEDFNSALRYFRVAAQRGHPDGYFNLGKTYESLGRNEEAVSAYYTYVKRRPSGRHAAAARAAIKTLEPHAKLPPESEPQPEPESEPESDPEPSPAEESVQPSEPATP